LHRTELCWRIGGKVAATKSRVGDGGGGEGEGRGVRLGFGRRDGVGGIRLGLEWWEGAFVKMARSVFVKWQSPLLRVEIKFRPRVFVKLF
jgi:hypothetical protein